MRTNLRLEKEHRNRLAQRRQVTQALAAQGLVRAARQPGRGGDAERSCASSSRSRCAAGSPPEQFEKDKKELFEGARKAAAQRVKIELMLAKIARGRENRGGGADLDHYIYREAARSKQKPEKIAKDLGKDRNALRSVQQAIIFDKAVDFLVSKATFTVTPS